MISQVLHPFGATTIKASGWLAPARHWPGVLLFGVIYGLTAQFGLEHSTLANNVTLIWPPSGISLFVIMRFGSAWWPGIVIGDLIGNATTQAPLAAVLGISAGNILSAVACAWMLKRYCDLGIHIARTRDVLALLVLGSAVSAFSATVGPASLALAGVISWTLYPSVWLQWLMGDATGVVVLAPLLLAWWQPLAVSRALPRIAEALVLACATLGFGAAVFGGVGVVREGYYPGALALFPLAVWAALRFGLRGATALTLAVSSFAVWGTMSGHGPFAVQGEMESLVRWWVFVNVISVTSLLLAVSRQERDLAQAALTRERDFVTTVLDTEAVLVLVLDRDGNVLRVNRAFEVLSGHGAAAMQGQAFIDTLIAPEHRAKVEAHDEILRLNLSNVARFDGDLLLRNGARRHIAWSNAALRTDAGTIRHRIITGIDITEQRRASVALRHARRDLEARVRERTLELASANAELEGQIAERQRLEREIIQAAEQEQRRIGHELHDSLGQKLTAAAFLTEVLSARLSEHDVDRSNEAGRIGAMLSDAIAETRMLARGLAPVDLDAEGLRTALTSLADTARRLFALRCELHCDPQALVHDRMVATNLYRIAQEAVTNAAKHSGASRVEIALRRTAGHLELSISDDGAGLPEQVRGSGHGMGLGTMRYRARAMGAALSVRSAPGKGVTLTVSVPHPQRDQSSAMQPVLKDPHGQD